MTTSTTTSRDQISNPYSKENRAEYKMGAVESWLHDLGFRTGYDNYHTEMDNRAAEWETQNQSLAYEENYNSEAAQAERMRAAGLNPDLQGLGDAAQASEMAEPEHQPVTQQTDLDYFQEVGSFASKIGGTLIDMFTHGTAGYATLKNVQLAQEKFESDRDIKESESIRDAALDALYNIGSDEEYENGGYIASQLGLTGKRFEKFSRYYDQIQRSIPGIIAKNEQETEAINTSFEREIADTMNNIKSIMAEAQTQGAQIILEKNKREAEFLKNNPNFNPAELEAEIQRGNKAAIEYRNISLEAQSKLDKINSDAISEYEEAMKEETKTFNNKTQRWEVNDEAWKRNFQRYRRARKRLGAKGSSFSAAGFGFSD